MRLAGIAGALAMLTLCLAGCGGSGETQLEQDVRSYLESNQRYHQVLAVPDDARLGELMCAKVGPLDMLACEVTVEGAGGGRYLVVRTARKTFALRRCNQGIVGGGPGTRGEYDSCEATIHRG
jgi:hypothetical protein